MLSNNGIVMLSDIIDIKHGFAFKGEFFKDEKTSNVLVTPGNFRIGGGFKADKFKYYDGPVEADYILKEGDLVVTMTDLSKQADTLGYSALIPRNDKHTFLHNQRVGLVTIKDEEKVDKKFLYFLLRTSEYRHFVVGSATGSTVKHTSPSRILSYSCELPDIISQKKIAKLLIELEERIDANSLLNSQLESLSQAIFKSWFVDFDPVHAKKNALEAGLTKIQAERASMAVIAGLCSPTEYAEDKIKIEKKLEERLTSIGKEKAEELKTTASLFPSEFEDSELNSVPKGWEVKPIKDLANVINGRAYKNDEFKTEGTPIVRIQNLSENGGKTVFSDLDLPEDKFIDKGDLIYAWSATFGPYIWKGRRSIYHYHIWKMVVTNYVCKHYLYLSLSRMTEHLKAQGTGSIFTHLTKTIMEEQKMLVPDEGLAKFSASIFENIFKLILQKNDEIKMLQELRDTLLPKLLSGVINLDKIQIKSEAP